MSAQVKSFPKLLPELKERLARDDRHQRSRPVVTLAILAAIGLASVLTIGRHESG